jgi:hypothetical protein
MLSVRDAAVAVSLSESKLRELIDRGVVTAVEVDGVMRVAVVDLAAFIERLRSTARKAPRPPAESTVTDKTGLVGSQPP